MKVAGIGASAGGIEAFKRFFENMPATSGVGFVVVLHMSAQRKSLLPDIIERWSSMPVVEAQDGQPVRPDHVHVIPSGHAATVTGGMLRLRPHVEREAAPIDGFFDSLAQDQGADAIGIVLSGAGHDGALGLKAIKARGGLTMAQGAAQDGADGSAPAYSGMPDSAIATGTVDIIVPVEEMPARLEQFLALEGGRERVPGRLVAGRGAPAHLRHPAGPAGS
jgi:two-component system, chemotaxis family, CheB/CheR fusion protein